MKRLKDYKHILALLAVPLIVITCMSIEDIINPTDPQVDSEIEIIVKIKIDAETDGTSKLAFGMLGPKIWNIASNATLTLTTSGYTPGDVIDEPLTLIPANELNPTSGTPWAASFQSEYGVLGNTGPVEWAVYQSQTAFAIHDKNGPKVVNGTVKIKIPTTSQNIKLFMGYAFCGKTHGFDSEKYTENVKSKELEVTGGSGATLDYTVVSLVSTVPGVFGYGDIFSVKFQEQTSTTVTGLVGADAVYLLGKVVYNGGQEKNVDATSSRTLMEKIGSDGTWQKYIYPKDFFDLPSDADITATYFYFSNQDKSIIVDDEGEGFFVIGE